MACGGLAWGPVWRLPRAETWGGEGNIAPTQGADSSGGTNHDSESREWVGQDSGGPISPGKGRNDHDSHGVENSHDVENSRGVENSRCMENSRADASPDRQSRSWGPSPDQPGSHPDQPSPEATGPDQGATAALQVAISRAQAELEALAARLQDNDGAEAREILSFQLALLDDPSLAAPAFAALEQAQAPTAEAAWLAAMDAEIAPYLSDPDEHFRARASDLIDLRDRVSAQLRPGGPTPLQAMAKPAGTVLLADDLTPSQFLTLDWSGGGAIVLAAGSTASHVALLARSRAIPMLVGSGETPPDVRFACVDGEAGVVIFDPEPNTLAAFQERLDAREQRPEQTALPLDQPARTATGEAVTLLLNIDDPAQLRDLDARICDGIGLARSEFLFLASGAADPATGLPDEDTQTQVYRQLLGWANGRPVTVRTLDLGGDKPHPGQATTEIDPALGLRGLRLSLLHPEGFLIQLRALARAACGGDLRVLLPMVTLPQEFAAAAALLDQALTELEAAGVPCRRPALGVMLEVPAAALTAERFNADFYAIGSNDLSQYTLAAGRSHADLADLQRAGWPVVLELIGLCIKAAEHRGRPICLCGEAATDLGQLEDLLSTGLRAISVPPAHLATVRQVIGSHGT